MNEADTCRTYVLPKLKAADWEDDYITEQLVLTPGRIVPIGDMHTRKDGLRPDYVLFIRQNIPIAVVESKAEYAHPGKGLQQAMQYAEMLDVRFAYSSNGKGIVEHDYITGMECKLATFPSPEELWGRLKGTFKFQEQKDETDALSQYWQEVNGKTPRYYQQVAINKAVNAVLEGKNRILLTMATGTGKTFVAFQIAWRLWKSKRRKRILYLADRNVLIDQAKDRTFSPMGQALHKIQGRALKSREVYFSLYQALANPVTGENLFEQYPRDFFDLIIVDECHRGSANEYGSWRKILDYFDAATQIGMTATPRRNDNVDTYDYFGDPIYTYSLKQGIDDGFLAPYRNTAQDYKSFHKLVTIACAAWNASILPAAERESMLADMRKLMPDQQSREDFTAIVKVLMKRKNRLYPKVNRMIVQFKVTDRGDDFHIAIASTMEKKKSAK